MKKFIFNLFLLFSFSIVFAQNAADVETSFGSLPGFNGIVKTIVEQPDGKILVGGSFTKYKGITCNYFVRLLSDGTVDPNFTLETTFWYGVTSIVIQPDGKILVGGGYSTPVNGEKVGIIRLNVNGSTDYTFDTMQKFSGVAIVNDMSLQADGKILAIGGFTTYDSVSRNGIVRINSDGGLDTTFDPGTGFNSAVNSLTIQPDGKMIIVGHFSNYNGYTRNKIIRLNSDATVDLTFSIGVGFNGGPTSILIQSNGSIVVAGNFNTYKNNDHYGIIRLLTNGDVDATFNPGVGFLGSNYTYVNVIAEDNTGNILIGGQFNKFNNISKNNCVRISANGYLDNSFTIVGLSQIYSFLLQSDHKIILGGDNYISRISNNGDFDYTFDYGSGLNNSLYVVKTLIQPDGKIIVGGDFTLYGLHIERGLIRLNADGTKDNTFNLNYLDYCKIDQMILQPNGKVIVRGTFLYTNSSPGSWFHGMRLNTDGSQDTTFDSSNLSNFVDYALQSDGKILLCNGFQVRRLNSNGTVDYTFNIGSGFDYYVKSIAVQSDDKIIVVGDFSIFNGEQHQRIVRLLPNGSIDTTFNTGEGFNGTARTISFQPDGKILVGGSFGSYNLISAWGIVRINTDGSYDSTFNSGFNINDLNSIVVQPDGKIIAGGWISYFVGSPLKNLVRFNSDGSVDSTFDIGTGFDMGNTSSYVSKINLQANGKILISGKFDTYKSISSSSLIRLNGGNTVMSNEGFSNEKIVLFPNPAHDYININLPNDNLNYDYEIIDLTGKTIIKKTNAKSSAIDTQSLTKGIYILKLESQQKEFTAKFIKE